MKIPGPIMADSGRRSSLSGSNQGAALRVFFVCGRLRDSGADYMRKICFA